MNISVLTTQAVSSTRHAAAAAAVSGRVTAFVADITQHEGAGALSQQLPGPVVDFCSMVFVLSAVAPHKMRQVGLELLCSRTSEWLPWRCAHMRSIL